jgi:hypothetical protein
MAREKVLFDAYKAAVNNIILQEKVAKEVFALLPESTKKYSVSEAASKKAPMPKCLSLYGKQLAGQPDPTGVA